MSRVVTLSKMRAAEVIVAKELLIAFEGASAESSAWLEVQGILNVGSKYVGFDGFLGVPVEEVG